MIGARDTRKGKRMGKSRHLATRFSDGDLRWIAAERRRTRAPSHAEIVRRALKAYRETKDRKVMGCTL